MAVRAVRPPHQVEVHAHAAARRSSYAARISAGAWSRAPGHGGSRRRIPRRHIDGNDAGNNNNRCGNAAPGAARDYYDVALEDGGVYRLLCDLRSGEWYVDGIYD